MKDSCPKIEDFIPLLDGIYRSIVSLSQLPLYAYIGKHDNHIYLLCRRRSIARA